MVAIWKTATHVLYCDQCNDLVMPNQRYITVGGTLLCEECAMDGVDIAEESVS